MASLQTTPVGHQESDTNFASPWSPPAIHDAKTRRVARERVVSIVAEAGVNVALPLLVYNHVAPHSGDFIGLLASSAPPLLWSVIGFMRRRRVDALSMMVLAGIVLSLFAMLGGGSRRFLQLRENLVSGVIGSVFLGSAAIGRPLIYQLACAGLARQSPSDVAAFQAKRENSGFHRVMMIMTLTWGIGMLASSALACLLVFSLSIHDYLIVSPIVGYGTMAMLGLWTVRCKRSAQQQAIQVAQ